MQRVLGTIGVIVLAALFLYFAAILFVGILAVGAIGYALYYARDYLIEKGILNPLPGVAPEPETPEQITVIEGDFERVGEAETLHPTHTPKPSAD